jgi:hypothetical protein
MTATLDHVLQRGDPKAIVVAKLAESVALKPVD